MEKYRPILLLIGAIVLFSILWPIIKWTAILILAAAAVFVAYIYIKSRVLKKEIQMDPKAYFTKQREAQKEKVSVSAIDAEYREKSSREVNND